MQQTTAALRARLTATSYSSAFLPPEEFKLKLRHELESRITMTHPIVKKILDGMPHWDLLRSVTLQGYQLTKHFLEYIETLYHHCPRGVHKKRLLLNMYEEETGRFSKTDNHVVLMENFIRAIGIKDAERDAAMPLPATRALIDYRMDLVRNRHTFHMGAAAVMIASEGQNLETAAGEARHELLPRIYSLTESDLQFFSVHQKEDVGHVAEGISLVADICTTPTMQQEALETVRKTCDLFYGMYEGMHQAYAA
ncbi:pyrroloquinoline quinone biosynthesis protein PqqC [Xanthomonas arboricola]|nr:pyrroloquinoline quinone biosynthesis protein PqqC [Xanthomonas arboricola]